MTRIHLALTFFILSTSIHTANAAPSVKAKLPAGQNLLVLARSDGSVESSAGATTGNVNVEIGSGTTARLYTSNTTTGKISGNVIVAIKNKTEIFTWKAAKSGKKCTSKSRAIYGVKTNGQLNVGSIKLGDGFGYVTASLKKAALDSTATGTVNTKCEPTGDATTLGYGTAAAQKVKLNQGIKIKADSDDSDSDGLADVFDADDDDDGTIDSYDTDTTTSNPPAGTLPSELRLFSNIKPEISESLNAYVQTLTDTAIDALVNRANLAIQVAGGTVQPTELNCGALTYCNSGGTGANLNQPFPANFDSDGDGKGTITNGPTGDFQLTTNTTKAAIGGGDILIEEVDNGDGTTTEIPVMLNFIFNSTPAIASLGMGGSTFTPTYPALNNMLGSSNNPFIAPAGWDKKLIVTAYRPQRPGISGAGEGELVDIGHSTISIDIPNGPCTTPQGGGCSTQNTSRCGAASYTESDSNLSSSGQSLVDGRDDQDTDTANPTANQLTFTVDLSTCISDSWDSGEKLGIDLQFSNNIGDNAAQKFYIQLP